MLSRDPVFFDLVQHPVAMRMLRATIGWPALLGNLSANIATPGASDELLTLLAYKTEGFGLVNGHAPR